MSVLLKLLQLNAIVSFLRRDLIILTPELLFVLLVLIYVHRYTRPHSSTHAHTTHTHTLINTHAHKHTHSHIQEHIHVQTQVHKRARTHTQTHMHKLAKNRIFYLTLSSSNFDVDSVASN